MVEKAKAPDLGEYIDAVRHNLSGPVRVFLENLDVTLHTLTGSLDRPDSLATARMFALSFGSIRSSTLLCQAGATAQVPVVVRHAVECALYGYLFRVDNEFEMLWANREDDPKAKRKFRNEGLQRAKAVLKKHDAALEDQVSAQLEFLISFGAHPNIFQVAGLIERQVYEDGSVGFENIGMLTSAKHRDRTYGMIAGGYVALIRMYGAIWPERFMLLGGPEKLQVAGGQFSNYRMMRGQS